MRVDGLKSPICLPCVEKNRLVSVRRYMTWIDECANCRSSRQVTHLDDWKPKGV